MTLERLFSAIGHQAPSLSVSGVTHDSRQVQPGFVFVALEGIPLATRAPLDGHRFIGQAIEQGAVAVVGSQDLSLSVPYARVVNPRLALAQLSAAFYDHPGQKLQLAGVTGSKGKTTIAFLLHHLLQDTVPVGRISTVGSALGQQERILSGHFTTPEAPQMQELLHWFVQGGAKQAVLEVSSHALALERVAGLKFEVGVFSNLFPDHLDFHGDMETYFAAKSLLLERSRFAIYHSTNPYTARFLGRRDGWSFGPGGDWQISWLTETTQGLSFGASTPLGPLETHLPMVGAFNAENALAAMAAAVRMGLRLEHLSPRLAGFAGVPGRMQLVQSQPFRVIIDFAHTGESLKAALQTLRPTTQGRLVVVIGAAGNQDPSRRSGIGQVSAQYADFAVFTEEDHRSEDLGAILQTMSQAHSDPQRQILIPDRREAIAWAIAHAQEGDTLLFSGKGHERTLERGKEVLPWNEAAEVRAGLDSAGH